MSQNCFKSNTAPAPASTSPPIVSILHHTSKLWLLDGASVAAAPSSIALVATMQSYLGGGAFHLPPGSAMWERSEANRGTKWGAATTRNRLLCGGV